MSFGNLFGGGLQALGIMTGAASTGISAGAAYANAEAQNYAADWNAAIYDRQAGNYRQAAGIERELGQKEAADLRREGRQMIGTQRALTGASGVKVDVGSSAAIQADTARWVEYDAQTALYNRELNAYKYETEADTMNMQAQMTRNTKTNPKLAAASAGLSGVSSILSNYGGW